MVPLFRLPFTLLDLALREARGAVRAVLGLLPWCGTDATPAVTAPEPRTKPERPAPPPPSASEALRRGAERNAAAAPPTRPTAPGHVDRGATVVESRGPEAAVGAAIDVDEPWDGYDEAPATEIVARVRDADPATKAVVALYERGHKARRTILVAAAKP